MRIAANGCQPVRKADEWREELREEMGKLVEVGCGGRPIERYQCSAAPIIDRVFSRLELLGSELDVTIRQRVEPVAPLLLDPWRVELGLLGPALSCLAATDGNAGAMLISLEVGAGVVVLRVVGTGARWGHRLRLALEGSLSARATEISRLGLDGLALAAARRAAETHGGWVGLCVQGRSELSLHLPLDPEGGPAGRTYSNTRVRERTVSRLPGARELGAVVSPGTSFAPTSSTVQALEPEWGEGSPNRCWGCSGAGPVRHLMGGGRTGTSPCKVRFWSSMTMAPLAAR